VRSDLTRDLARHRVCILEREPHVDRENVAQSARDRVNLRRGGMDAASRTAVMNPLKVAVRHASASAKEKTLQAFTLVEIMILVAIIGLLA